MKVNLAKSAGFCFGVKRALDIALKTAKSSSRVLMLGDIVHNEDVIKETRKAGIRKISRLVRGKGSILLIRAHGTGSATIKKAKALGYDVVDASCPMVKEIHRIALEMEQAGYKIIIIGDRKHDEVQGIIGQLKNKALVIEASGKIPLERIKGIKQAAVLSQSTQNLEKVLPVVKELKRHIKEIKFFNTICRPTRIKQEEIRSMPLENDVMIIIGSKTSANTRRLFEISKALNKRTYRIRSKKEIRPVWFKNAQKVGITAGASTPQWITEEVVRYIKSF
ncbi:MAG: 4-hydroxy-3-methylbut-2-enyl diphosphate reductase [Candidatus Omnitrophota bacterium]